MDRPLYPDDIVVSKANDNYLAVVERTHADVDSHNPYPGRDEVDRIKHARNISHAAFKQFMKDGVPPKGTVLLRWTHMPNAELVNESQLRLLDRSLLIGDVVKRDPNDAMSGVVINTFTRCTLLPMGDVKYRGTGPLKGLLPPTTKELNPGIKLASSPAPLVDIPAAELMYAESPNEEELVIYKDWIGRVTAVVYMIALKLADGTVVEIQDEHAEHADSALDMFSVGDIAITKKGQLRTGKWIFGQYNPNTHPVGTVVSTRAIAAEVIWLERRIGSTDDREPPTTLEREELESASFKVYDRTRRPPKQISPDSEIQTETTSNSEIDARLRLRVRFKDLSGASVKYDGSTPNGTLPRLDRKDTLGYDLNVFDVLSFRTDVTVQWQDLSVTQESSTDLVPDASIDDEHAAWPGEIAHTLDIEPYDDLPGVEGPSKVGVVQSVNAVHRMAKVMWCTAAAMHYSVDPDEETGIKQLVTAMTGPPGEGPMEEVSLYDVETPAVMNVRRGDIVLMGGRSWFNGVGPPTAEDVDWLGEIVDTCLDGTLIIRLGAAAVVRDVKMRREHVTVAIRSDGTDGIDEWEENGLPDDFLGWGDLRPGDQHPGSDGEYSWEDEDDYSDEDDEDDEEEQPRAQYEDENGESMDEDEAENEDWESADDGEDAVMVDAGGQAPPPTLQSETAVSEQPPTYFVFEEAVPTNHHYASKSATESANHMKRVQKEHRILQKPSAIPTGVYVRTWESRLDLIRALLIGPSDTPYDSAPFVVDFYLPPQFPTEPPQAYFHSWPGESGMGGVGRVNPNLYEDGKICLSLLGTWEGNKGEGWNAGRSTLLQVIVSLLGLVLVKEPYFNEAGYEHLAGLEASKRPSALYNERTFLRSKGFVITALSRLSQGGGGNLGGLQGFEDVIRWSYIAPDGPRLLEKVIGDVKAVLERSNKEDQDSDGLTVMSKGACVPLRRVLERMEKLQR